MARVADRRTEIKASILDTIGETPVIRLSRIAAGVKPQVVAKAEQFNPGGSIKDRVAVRLIEAAERDGHLRPGGTLVEPTSGNTGTGLAIAARLKGYRVIAVMPDKMSREKIDLLRAYGAEVVIAPTDVPPDSPQSYYRVADRLTEEIAGAFQPNQYANLANPRTHYESTGPELWRQTAGAITHLVAGVGTGGTITGAGEILKERNPRCRVIAVEPRASAVLSGGRPGPHKIQGIGAGFVPPVLDTGLLDEIVAVDDEDAIETARAAARREGVLCGISCGAALWAALEVAQRPEAAGKRVAVVLPDSGERYVSTPFFAPEAAVTP
jgi:cystathionine beta-synthase